MWPPFCHLGCDMKLLPPSAVRAWIPWVGFVTLLAVMSALRTSDFATITVMTLLIIVYAVPVLLLDMAGQKSPGSSVASASYFAPRLASQFATFAVVLLLYWMFPYTRAQWLFPVIGTLGGEYVWPALIFAVLATTLYIALTRADKDDAAVHIGEMLLRQRPLAFDAQTKNYGLSWLVKAFFLPLMAMFMAKDVIWFRAQDWSGLWTSFPSAYEFLHRFIYFCDVTIALAGYLLTFRWAGTHIRSAEPTAVGWAVCLVCYPPFWPGFYDNFFAYENGKSWTSWLWDSQSWLHIGWGSLILLLGSIYLWATIAFGVRFSNLTHRGIITNGPYRFSKHPAYIAKNISWWMVSVPFLQSSGYWDALRLSLLLLCVNGIYYARAKTEERHLLRDPVYQDYAAWIAEHGLIARVRKLLQKRL
jgi:Isoprenylcysteine carboxyl methyltransferase (ICMT) family